MPDLNPALTTDQLSSWIETCALWWEEGSAYNFAIVDPSDDKYFGGCGLTHINQRHSFANLAYWVRSSATGRGAATSATRLLARFAFEEVGLQRVEIVVAVGNEASARVAEKAGALLEGTLRNRIRLHDKMYDAFMYSLVPGAKGL